MDFSPHKSSHHSLPEIKAKLPMPERSKATVPVIFLKEAPEVEDQEVRNHLKDLMSKGFAVVIPLIKQLVMPVDEAWSLVSLKELSEGAHKQLPAGSRLVISVSPEEIQEELLMYLNEVTKYTEFILDEGSLSLSAGAQTGPKGLEEYLEEIGLSFKVISPSNLPKIILRENLADLARNKNIGVVVRYIDLGNYYSLNKTMSKYVDFKRNLFDEADSNNSNTVSDSIQPIGIVYQF